MVDNPALFEPYRRTVQPTVPEETDCPMDRLTSLEVFSQVVLAHHASGRWKRINPYS